MSFVTLDFETYYAKGLGFKTQTTEEYVRDRRFEVIGVGVKIDDQPATWFSGTKDEIKEHLMKIDWSEAALLCHNTLFDGCVLNWHFGILPKYFLDTLCMARAIHGVDAGGSLQALAKRYEIGEKGDEVIHAEGKKRLDFSEEELHRYGEYCKNDVGLTYKLFNILASAFPEDELDLIDMTLRMFIDPVFHVDDALLQDRLIELKEEKLALLQTLMEALKCKDEEEVRKKLASNKQFALVLAGLGVAPPMKVSPRTGKDTYALAKNDEGFLALTEHEDPFVQQLCSVRLGTKSTIEESRIERFIDVDRKFKFSTYEVEDSVESRRAIESNGEVSVDFFSESQYLTTLTTYTPSWSSSPAFGGTTVNNIYCASVTNAAGQVTYTNSVAGSLETGRVERGERSGQNLENSYGTFDAWTCAKYLYRILPESQRPIVAGEIRSYCTGCGTRIKKSNWKFCPSCGTEILA